MNSSDLVTAPCLYRRCRRVAGRGLVCAAALLPCLPHPSARADETTRRLQEELRKRNLYFGDVDGRTTPQLSAALHRYQERKGFSSTGEPDADTLYSLNIARFGDTSPRLATAVPSPTMPPPLDARDGGPVWPDVVVLRSDEARPTPAGGEANAVAAGETLAHAAPTATPAPPPASAGMLRRPTEEEVRDYVARYLEAGQNNREEAELSFYGDHIAFFDEGNVDHAYLARAVTRYDHRWPDRHFVVLGPVTFAPSPEGDPDKFVVNFRMGFNVKSSRYTVAGKTDNTWTVAGHDPGSWKIVAMKEQRVREK